jgi:hypothetical protein
MAHAHVPPYAPLAQQTPIPNAHMAKGALLLMSAKSCKQDRGGQAAQLKWLHAPG